MWSRGKLHRSQLRASIDKNLILRRNANELCTGHLGYLISLGQSKSKGVSNRDLTSVMMKPESAVTAIRNSHCSVTADIIVAAKARANQQPIDATPAAAAGSDSDEDSDEEQDGPSEPSVASDTTGVPASDDVSSDADEDSDDEDDEDD